MSIPRSEYPRPQLVRNEWINLNGEWEYEFDFGTSGRARGLAKAQSLDGRITLPFCPESSLSGVGYTDFIPAIWYRREVVLPDGWAGNRVFLRFQAADYTTEVWVNGVSVGRHEGGYSSFGFDVTSALRDYTNVIVVCCEDDVRGGLQARGKQSDQYDSYACLYTRTTGIWQTVWLEAVPNTFISRLKTTPNLESENVSIEVKLDGPSLGFAVEARALLDGVEVGKTCSRVSSGTAVLVVPIDPESVKVWEPGSPVLYDLDVSLVDGDRKIDRVSSYFGLRSIDISGPAILLNGKPMFQRLVLDQGFYPDGIYTASSDDALRGDIELSQAMGFNGARLHQKVFEERFLYWADKLGYVVWGEMPDWGMNFNSSEAILRFTREWMEVIQRDYNHPSIVGWCPFNETATTVPFPNVLQPIYHLTKQYDSTRPVLDTSGYLHTGLTDVYDCHDYDQDPVTLAERFVPFAETGVPPKYFPLEAPYMGQPYFISEYGGIWWNPGQDEEKSWGYGGRPTSEEEFIARYKGLTDILLDHPRMCGFCYTQLTNVEQEVNGLYTYDRKAKFDPAIFKAINSRKAAIEK